jgi:hypothetical protein
VNQRALDNPKLNVIFGDGRELLLTSKEQYDLIVSEPSNPYRAGIASLFTREFYEAVERRLAPGGVFVQWVQSYEVDRRAVDLVYATLSSSFPAIETWRTHRDLLLMASRKELGTSAADLYQLMGQEPYRSALRISWNVSDLEGLLSYFVAEPAHAREITRAQGSVLNTDDKNLLEFGFARSVGKDKLFSLPEALARAHASGHDRPERLRSGVDWAKVDRERERLAQGSRVRTKATFDARHATLLELLDAAVDGAGKAREDPVLLERLQALAPAAADAVRADALFRSGQKEEALRLLENFFARLRQDPWVETRVVFQALNSLRRIAKQDRALAPRVLRLLSEPFAARVAHDTRQEILFELTEALELAPACARALDALEPWVPWNKSFLERRVHCYELSRDPRLERARAELEEFKAAEVAEAGTR